MQPLLADCARQLTALPLPRVSVTGFVRGGEWLLTAILALALADVVWLALPPPPPPAAASVPRPPPSPAMLAVGAGYAQTPRLALLKNLFGAPPEGASPAAHAALEPERETALDLTLKGVLAHPESGTELALIARGSETEAVYSPGETIAGAEILRIEARRVILRRNGVTESLSLALESLPRVAPAATGGGGVRTLGPHDRVLERAAVQRGMANLPQLLRQAEAVPHTENGAAVGLRVVRVDDGSVFDDLGLRAQDIIRSVNGAPVLTAQDALQAYEAFKASGSYAIGVLRDGHEVTLNYAIE